MISRLFSKNSFLHKNQIYYCCQKLLVFNEFLNSDVEIHKLELEKLRIELVKFTYDVLKFKLSLKDRDRTMHVEHYFQNGSSSTKINEFEFK